jgi:hypothetical protein
VRIPRQCPRLAVSTGCIWNGCGTDDAASLDASYSWLIQRWLPDKELKMRRFFVLLTIVALAVVAVHAAAPAITAHHVAASASPAQPDTNAKNGW